MHSNAGILSPDSSHISSLSELREVTRRFTIRIGTGDGKYCATGTLVNIRGRLMVATAKHVADDLFFPLEGYVLMAGCDVLAPPVSESVYPTWGGEYRLLAIHLPKEVAGGFRGSALSHPDVALLDVDLGFDPSRYARCLGSVLLPPYTDLTPFAAGFPADYEAMCVLAHGDDFDAQSYCGVTIYSMRGLAEGTLSRASGLAAASHGSFGGMSGGGLWVRTTPGGWHYAGTVFLEDRSFVESRRRTVGDRIYAVAANELTAILPD